VIPRREICFGARGCASPGRWALGARLEKEGPAPVGTGPITVRDHRRPRLYRAITIHREHHRALSIPGVRGQRPRAMMARGEAAAEEVVRA